MNKKLVLTLFTICMFNLAHVALAQQEQPPQMDTATQIKIDACAASAKMPERHTGIRPTKEQHEAFKACLDAQKIKMPHHPHHDGPPPEERQEPQNQSQGSQN